MTTTPTGTTTGALQTEPVYGTVCAAARPLTSQRIEPGWARRWDRFERSKWALILILVIQTALAMRLVWSNTAFQDEALYIWTGHMEWSHWLHGTPMPDVSAVLSGAPSVYPPVVAYADSIAGLVGARLLSLVFMLIATTLLHGVTRRLFDRRSALLATALFACLGSVSFVGVLATYDAMALMLIALGTWLGVRAASASRRARPWWLLSVALALAAANLAKYASFLFDPVVIATVGLLIWSANGRRAGIRAALLTGVTVIAALFAFLKFAAPSYWAGIQTTTLSRQHSNSPATFVLSNSFMWIGVVMALGLVGAVVLACTRRGPAWRLLAVVLGVAPFLAPLEQARIETLTSLFKHVAFGAWFGAILGGLALASLVNAVPAVKRRAAKTVALVAVLLAAIPGISFANEHYTNGWPNVTKFMTVLKPLVNHAERTGERMLFDQKAVIEYYQTHSVDAQNIFETESFNYNNPKTGIWTPNTTLALREAIHNKDFEVIGLTPGTASNVYDSVIVGDIHRSGTYHLVARIPGAATSTDAHPTDFLIYEVNKK